MTDKQLHTGDDLLRVSYHACSARQDAIYPDGHERTRKRCFSLGLIRTKTEVSTFSAIGLSILTTNLFRILARAGHYIFVFLKILFLPDIPPEEREIVYWAHAC